MVPSPIQRGEVCAPQARRRGAAIQHIRPAARRIVKQLLAGAGGGSADRRRWIVLRTGMVEDGIKSCLPQRIGTRRRIVRAVDLTLGGNTDLPGCHGDTRSLGSNEGRFIGSEIHERIKGRR